MLTLILEKFNQRDHGVWEQRREKECEGKEREENAKMPPWVVVDREVLRGRGDDVLGANEQTCEGSTHDKGV